MVEFFKSEHIQFILMPLLTVVSVIVSVIGLVSGGSKFKSFFTLQSLSLVLLVFAIVLFYLGQKELAAFTYFIWWLIHCVIFFTSASTSIMKSKIIVFNFVFYSVLFGFFIQSIAISFQFSRIIALQTDQSSVSLEYVELSSDLFKELNKSITMILDSNLELQQTQLALEAKIQDLEKQIQDAEKAEQ